MAGNIAFAGGLRHVCGCSPARHDGHRGASAQARKVSLFSGLENFGDDGLPRYSRRLMVALLRSSSYLFRRITPLSFIFSSESRSPEAIT